MRIRLRNMVKKYDEYYNVNYNDSFDDTWDQIVSGIYDVKLDENFYDSYNENMLKIIVRTMMKNVCNYDNKHL